MSALDEFYVIVIVISFVEGEGERERCCGGGRRYLGRDGHETVRDR